MIQCLRMDVAMNIERIRTSFLPYIISVVLFLCVSVAMTLALPYFDLYGMNQQHHALHGLAMAGHGYLANDWYVSTPNPFPLYSLLISTTYTFIGVNMLYVYHALFVGLFVYSLVGITLLGLQLSDTKAHKAALFTAVLVIFSEVTARLLHDYLFFPLDSAIEIVHGMADQYLIRRNLEPATFGVLLLASVWAFLAGKRYLAVALGGAAAIIHAAYIQHFGLLSISYLILVYKENRDVGAVLKLGSFAALCALPVFVLVISGFTGNSAEIAEEAARISVYMRAPRHWLLSYWFGPRAIVQMVLCVGTIVLFHRKPLAIILLPLCVFLVGSIAVQAIIQNNRFALLMPWRVSVLTTPLSLMALAGWGIDRGIHWLQTRTIRLSRYAVVAAVLLFGCYAYLGPQWKARRTGPYRPHPAAGMTEYVRNTRTSGDMYVIPQRTDRPMDSFRIQAGVPVFVTYKVIPYSPEGAIEWYRRMQLRDSLYSANNVPFGVISELQNMYHVTHVAARTAESVRFDTLSVFDEVYCDDQYVLYRLTDTGASGRP